MKKINWKNVFVVYTTMLVIVAVIGMLVFVFINRGWVQTLMLAAVFVPVLITFTSLSIEVMKINRK